jgi:hypothetical protein
VVLVLVLELAGVVVVDVVGAVSGAFDLPLAEPEPPAVESTVDAVGVEPPVVVPLVVVPLVPPPVVVVGVVPAVVPVVWARRPVDASTAMTANKTILYFVFIGEVEGMPAVLQRPCQSLSFALT